MADVVAKVEKIVAQKQFGEQRVEATFPGDLFYLITVPEEGVVERDGKTMFTTAGIRHIVKDLTVILYFETEESDY